MATSSDRSSRPSPNRAPPPEETAAHTVVVVRLPEPSRRFAWEIRKLSVVVIARSPGDFETADLARADGRAALDALLAVG